jgi:hypothetical protein
LRRDFMGAAGSTPGEHGWFRTLVAIATVFVVLTIASIAVVVIPLGHVSGPADGPEQGFRTFVADVNNQNWEAADQFLSVQLIKSGVSSQSAFEGTYGISLISVSVVRQGSGDAELLAYLTFKDEYTFHPAQSVSVTMVAEGNVWKVDTAFWTQLSSY